MYVILLNSVVLYLFASPVSIVHTCSYNLASIGTYCMLPMAVPEIMMPIILKSILYM
jgi:hypothetical protein